MEYVINICSPEWDPMDSYGKIATGLSDYLRFNGYHVNEIGHNSRQKKFIPTTGGVFLGYPTWYDQCPAICHIGKKVSITMFESSEIPQTWVSRLNTGYNTIVPSKFCYEVFIDAGVHPESLKVCNLGISDEFSYVPRDLQGPIKFLAFFDRGRRKGYDYALRAFLDAFGEDPRYHLTLKSRARTDGFFIHTNYNNVEVVMEDLELEELSQFYGKFHFMILPTRGEGWGWLPREFAATGGLPLVTGWSASAEDIDQWGIPLNYTLVPAWPWHRQFSELGMWAQPDIVDIREKLLYVRDNFFELMEDNYERSKRTRALYPWSNFFKTVEDTWNDNSIEKEVLSQKYR